MKINQREKEKKYTLTDFPDNDTGADDYYILTKECDV